MRQLLIIPSVLLGAGVDVGDGWRPAAGQRATG